MKLFFWRTGNPHERCSFSQHSPSSILSIFIIGHCPPSSSVFDWGTWGCPASKFPWTYGSTESCYLLKGKVTVTPSDGRRPVTIGKGDFATFPAGMSCTWDVAEAVEKHYMFF